MVFLWLALSLLCCKDRYKVATALSNGRVRVSQRNRVQGWQRGTLPGEKPPLAWELLLEVSAEIPISHKRRRICCPETALWGFTF